VLVISLVGVIGYPGGKVVAIVVVCHCLGLCLGSRCVEDCEEMLLSQ
jgi:hypothetical protein